MPGLLDLTDDPNQLGLLSLGLRLMSTPGKFGVGFGQAGLGALGDIQAAQQAAEQKKLREQQYQSALIQQQLQALQLKQAQDEALRRQRLDEAAQDSVLSPQQVALMTYKGPTQAAADAAPTAAPGFNWRAYQGRVAGIDPMAALQIEAALRKDQAKLKSTEIMRGPDGKLVNVALFDDGTTKVLPYGVKPEIALQALGDRVMAVDKNALSSGASFAMGQSPDSKASNALGWKRLEFDKDQANKGVTYQQDEGGNFVALPTHAAPGSVVRAAPVVAPGGGLTPLQGKGAGMTEDQAKASGWLVQATNAYRNMVAAINPQTGTPSAVKPGINDALAAVPSFGAGEALGNWMRGEDRQKFLQGASSLSEALLRAATGAGVNKDEAAQKVRELTPVAGDSAAVIKQKLDAIPLYIQTLQMRAGPGARKANAILGGQDNDPLGLGGR